MTDTEQAMEAIVREASDRAGPKVTGEDPRFVLSGALGAMLLEARSNRPRALLIAAAMDALLTRGRTDAELRALQEVIAAESVRRTAAACAKLTVIAASLPEEAGAALAKIPLLLEEQRAAVRQTAAGMLESIRERRRRLAEVFGEQALRSPEWAAAIEYFNRAFARSVN